MAQFGWHVNIDNCIGCRACEAACKQEFDRPVGVRRRRVIVEEGGASGAPWRRTVTMACMHCANPACVRACPVGRWWKDADPAAYAQPGADVAALRAYYRISGAYTGIVLMKPPVAEDATLGADCIGCKRCAAACPYGAPQWDVQAQAMDKCTACVHRQFPAAGSTVPAERSRPACVVSCTALALGYGDLATVSSWAQRRPADPLGTTTWSGTAPAGGKDITEPSWTTPSVRFTPHRSIP